LTAAGGMCYSIYLWHNIIVSGVGNFTIHFNPFRSYLGALFWHMAILLPAVVLGSTVFYLLVEKPCMDREWPQKLWAKLKSLFRKKIINNTLVKVE
jgi:peptidoglycan/LPS O-acetylase OafA/YrhL